MQKCIFLKLTVYVINLMDMITIKNALDDYVVYFLNSFLNL